MAILLALLTLTGGSLLVLTQGSQKSAAAATPSRVTNPDAAVAFKIGLGASGSYKVDQAVTSVWPVSMHLATSGVANEQVGVSVVQTDTTAAYLRISLVGSGQGPIEASLVEGSLTNAVVVTHEQVTPGELPSYLVPLDPSMAKPNTTLIVWVANAFQNANTASAGGGDPRLRAHPLAVAELASIRYGNGIATTVKNSQL